MLSETDYEKWKPRRRALDPAFHKRLKLINTLSCMHCARCHIIASYKINATFCSFLRAQISKFDCCTQQLINSLKSLADEQYVVSMKEFLHDATSDIISQVYHNIIMCIYPTE